MSYQSATQPALLPANEQQRIQALYSLRILDTDPEPLFDDLTALAAAITGCPIALVSLIDVNRQWFKAKCGIDGSETDRSVAFCAHAILGDDILEIPDAREDSRFAANPLVVGEPGIRFYAGVPLRSAQGFCYGTLCVIDTKPRRLDSGQRVLLRKLAAQVLHHMEARLQNQQSRKSSLSLARLLEFLPDALITTDVQGNLQHVNSIARQWHGVDPSAIPRERWREFFHLYEADGQTLLPLQRNPLTRVLDGETVKDEEMLIRASGQLDRIVLCNGDYLADESGVRVGAVVVMRDVTAFREASRRLASTQAFLQNIIDASDTVAIITTDCDGLITLFNTGAERLLGYAAADMVGRQTPAAFHLPRQVEQRAQELSELHGAPVAGFDVFVHEARRGGTETRQWTYVCRDGSRRQVRLSVCELHDTGGAVTGFLGMAIDLTPLLEAEEAARLGSERFFGAFAAAAQGMALTSLEGRFIEINDALCRMLGYTREEMQGLTFQRLTHPDDLDNDLSLIERLLAGEIDNYHLEKRYLSRQGQVLYVMLSVSLVRGRHGLPLHFVKQILDITLQKRMERMKDEFVSTVSHELRTPLTSISGALGLIQGGVLGAVPAEMSDMLGVAHLNSRRLTTLINDLLDMDKLLAGKMNFTLQTCELQPLLDEALATMANYAGPLGVALVRSGSEPVLVHVDPLRLVQVLMNLLSNACKFSPRESTVVLAHGCEGDSVVVSVSDQGQGVPETFRERIFQKFSQADTTASRSKGGTGLGLAICKEMVERMGGTIGFESEQGRGSRFWFRLPLPASVELQQHNK